MWWWWQLHITSEDLVFYAAFGLGREGGINLQGGVKVMMRAHSSTVVSRGLCAVLDVRAAACCLTWKYPEFFITVEGDGVNGNLCEQAPREIPRSFHWRFFCWLLQLGEVPKL